MVKTRKVVSIHHPSRICGGAVTSPEVRSPEPEVIGNDVTRSREPEPEV